MIIEFTNKNNNYYITWNISNNKSMIMEFTSFFLWRNESGDWQKKSASALIGQPNRKQSTDLKIWDVEIVNKIKLLIYWYHVTY